jgi:hypothetical protein
MRIPLAAASLIRQLLEMVAGNSDACYWRARKHTSVTADSIE